MLSSHSDCRSSNTVFSCSIWLIFLTLTDSFFGRTSFSFLYLFLFSSFLSSFPVLEDLVRSSSRVHEHRSSREYLVQNSLCQIVLEELDCLCIFVSEEGVYFMCARRCVPSDGVGNGNISLFHLLTLIYLSIYFYYLFIYLFIHLSIYLFIYL